MRRRVDHLAERRPPSRDAIARAIGALARAPEARRLSDHELARLAGDPTPAGARLARAVRRRLADDLIAGEILDLCCAILATDRTVATPHAVIVRALRREIGATSPTRGEVATAEQVARERAERGGDDWPSL